MPTGMASWSLGPQMPAGLLPATTAAILCAAARGAWIRTSSGASSAATAAFVSYRG